MEKNIIENTRDSLKNDDYFKIMTARSFVGCEYSNFSVGTVSGGSRLNISINRQGACMSSFFSLDEAIDLRDSLNEAIAFMSKMEE